MSIWKVGMKAVCIDGGRHEPDEPGPYTKTGQVYTVSAVLIERSSCGMIPTLLFEELEVVRAHGWCTGYDAQYFRPVLGSSVSASLVEEFKKSWVEERPEVEVVPQEA